jgi:hypothetical protein
MINLHLLSVRFKLAMVLGSDVETLPEYGLGKIKILKF